MTFSSMWNTPQTRPVLPRNGVCGPLRQITESLALLAVAVTVFRGFAVEGYMISTGSMAPTLLGYHHSITCPECEFQFAHGTIGEETVEHVETAWAKYDIGQPLLPVARCPNCGFHGISTEKLARTEGDQLLVHKHAYAFRDPRRWEVIVFRNPGDPRQAYVKRVVGLPGESIEISRGEVLVNGELARKPYPVQQSIRIPVSEYASQVSSEDPDAQPVWVKLDPSASWTLNSDSLRSENPSKEISWIGYRHWILGGGTHRTSVKLNRWPAGLQALDPEAGPMSFRDGMLHQTGVMTEFDRKNWMARSDDPAFHAALQELCLQSHIAPITDDYGYNSADSHGPNHVRDFSVSMTLKDVSGQGRFEIELTDGNHIFSAVFKFAANSVEVLRDSHPVPVRDAKLASNLVEEPLTIDFSLIDRQVVLALNGEEVIEPFSYEAASDVSPMRRPVRFGTAELNCTVTNLKLYRDVYYTSRPDKEHSRFILSESEFFVLGDNSPVSVDSRVWTEPGVPRGSLIGKPLVVHLPSRSSRVKWGGKTQDVRVPDFSRVRWIR
ncbi:signal peptidase I [Planctomicrobium sp. SH661]|uniref:signal peptidase I n=1 Tax=Planctomicrobium sp. SH661 TaxID=3448124 RepID=UPI003F5C7D48